MQTKMNAGATLFDVWMRQESDIIQALAKAHGGRIVLEQTLIAINKLQGRSRYIWIFTLLFLWTTLILQFHVIGSCCIF